VRASGSVSEAPFTTPQTPQSLWKVDFPKELAAPLSVADELDFNNGWTGAQESVAA
jgi:hypothetical protein